MFKNIHNEKLNNSWQTVLFNMVIWARVTKLKNTPMHFIKEATYCPWSGLSNKVFFNHAAQELSSVKGWALQKSQMLAHSDRN